MRTHTLEVWLDDLSIKDLYTESDGRRLPAPILDDLQATIAPSVKGLDELLAEIEEASHD